jgi:NAD(P)-dependent dehydrogenase (short-subunit alcohol dehydrogenase family)
MAADPGLAGRLAIVTGALGTLGPTWTTALREAGMEVVGIDLAPAPPDHPTRIEVGDVTDRAALERIRAPVESELGVPWLLLNNAGVDTPPVAGSTAASAESIPLDEARRTLDVNVVGTLNAIQVFGPAMRDAGRGSIVNIGSLYASVAPEPSLYDHLEPPFVKPPAYGASKAAVVNLTRYFARLWGPYGVRVNVLSPGGVRGGQDEDFLRKYCARVPLGRMAEPADLVGPLLFLASDASRYVTGQELRVDGGFTA